MRYIQNEDYNLRCVNEGFNYPKFLEAFVHS